MVLAVLRKIVFILVAVLTLGTAVPFMPPHTATRPGDKGNYQSEKEQQSADQSEEASPGGEWVREASSDTQLIEAFARYAARESRIQGLHKFGSRIGTEIGDDYVHTIVPAFIPAVEAVSAGHDRSWIRQLAVTHDPAAGTGERILHVYQRETNQELLKLHVRRDHPPKDGFWFDFHYHSVADNFQQHHSLKRIYWGKNTPPNWRA
ncbi:MAG: YpjP family protein [Sporolactobacillus sp.]